MKHIIKPALSLFIIAAIITTALVFTYKVTKDPIANQLKKTQEKKMREVFPEAEDYNKILDFSKEKKRTGNILSVYEGLKGTEIIGYVVELDPPGYSGKIIMMVGISKAEDKITGMRIIKQTETPGLGALAVKEKFYRRFDGKPLVPLKVVKISPKEDEIEAITASTVTTKAITRAVNEAIAWFNVYTANDFCTDDGCVFVEDDGYEEDEEL